MTTISSPENGVKPALVPEYLSQCASPNHHFWDWNGHDLAAHQGWWPHVVEQVRLHKTVVWDVPTEFWHYHAPRLLESLQAGDGKPVRISVVCASNAERAEAGVHLAAVKLDAMGDVDEQSHAERCAVTRSDLPSLRRDLSEDTVIVPRARRLLDEVATAIAVSGLKRGKALASLHRLVEHSRRSWWVLDGADDGERTAMVTFLGTQGSDTPLWVRLRCPVVADAVLVVGRDTDIRANARAAVATRTPFVLLTATAEAAEAMALTVADAAARNGVQRDGWCPLVLLGRRSIDDPRARAFLSRPTPEQEPVVVATVDSMVFVPRVGTQQPFRLFILADTFPKGPSIASIVDSLGRVPGTWCPLVWAPGARESDDADAQESAAAFAAKTAETQAILRTPEWQRTLGDALADWRRGCRALKKGESIAQSLVNQLNVRGIPWRAVMNGAGQESDRAAFRAEKEAAAANRTERLVAAGRTIGEQAALGACLRKLGVMETPDAQTALAAPLAHAVRCLDGQFRSHQPVQLALAVLRPAIAKGIDKAQWMTFATRYDLQHHSARARLMRTLLEGAQIEPRSLLLGEGVEVSADNLEGFIRTAAENAASMRRWFVSPPTDPTRAMRQLFALLRSLGCVTVSGKRGTDDTRRYVVCLAPELKPYLRERCAELGAPPPPQPSTSETT